MMLHLRHLPAAAPVLLALNLAAAAPEAPTAGEWGGSLRSGVYYGRAEGYLQTPAGGEPGSSSLRRPTLEELDIDDAVFYDVLGSVRWRRLEVYAGWQAIHLDGGATLSEALVSRDQTFAAGTRVQAQTDLDWVRLGAAWRFEAGGGRLSWAPKAELAVLDFSYELSGGGQAVDRGYAKGALRLGVEGRYRFTRVTSLFLDVGASVPLSNTPQIAAATGGVDFNLLPGHRRLQPHAFLGVGAQRIDYEDNQELPNHIRVDLKPFVTAGLGLSF